jgi:hypothetical protein
MTTARNQADVENQLDDDTREQIILNLTTLRVSEESAERIMNAIENMRCKNQIKGALKFLTTITNEKSKREEYYLYSNFIAEFFCTISNLGLFAVGIYFEDFAILLAATFSAISHAIPLQRLNELDKLGVLIIFVKALINYKIFLERPELFAWGAGALAINVLDTFITPRYLEKIGPSLHVIWHLAAALVLFKIEQAQVEVNAAELQAIAIAAASSTVPAYLSAAHEKISTHMEKLALSFKKLNQA